MYGSRPPDAAPQPPAISSDAETARFMRDRMLCIPCPACLAEDTGGRPRGCPYCAGGWVLRDLAPLVAAKAGIEFDEQACADRILELLGEMPEDGGAK